ncbi:unnamed protein product [Sympodiomycopsis kandeliae]
MLATKGSAGILWWIAISLFSIYPHVSAQTTNPAASRWGQSSSLLSSLFVVHGGKTEGTTGGGYTYTSGPNSADLLALDLSNNFAVGSGSSPPWQVISPGVATDSTASANNATSPAVCFGTLAPISSTALILFGGDGAPVVPVQTRNDSLYSVELSSSSNNTYTATWTKADSSWSEPMRRTYASSESNSDGDFWLIGGEKADGSGASFDEAWTVSTSGSSHAFSPLQPPTGSIVGQTSTLLSDGTLLLLGGQDTNGQLHSFDSVVTYDTKKGHWQTVNVTTSGSGIPPVPRRGHVAVSLPSQRIFMHGGSSDTSMTTALGDAWILDWSSNPPRWSQIDMDAGGPTARFGHSAVAYGRKVVMAFGWTGGNPADSAAYVFDATKLDISSQGKVRGSQWAQTYSPDPEVQASTPITSGNSGSSSSSNNPEGNGSSTSSGGQSSGSQESGSSSSNHHFGDGNTGGGGGSQNGDGNGNTDGNAGSDKGTSGAAKAGAVIGAFIGIGLAVAGGYAAYHKFEQRRLNNWRHGDGSHALLGMPDVEGGAGGGGYFYEKARDPYTAGVRPAGPRSYGRAGGAGVASAAFPAPTKNNAGSRAHQMEMANIGVHQREPTVVPVWSPTAAGHAIEGPGPRMRDRLAMFTGFAAWAPQSQPRFDMLADEDEVEAHYAGNSRQRGHVRRSGYDDEHESEVDDAEGGQDMADMGAERHVKERSYGRVGQYDPDVHEEYEQGDGQSLSSGDQFSADDPYVTPPFEDNHYQQQRIGGPRSYESRSGQGLLAVAGAAFGVGLGRRAQLGSDDSHSSNSGHIDSVDAPSGSSNQTHVSLADSSARSVREVDSVNSSNRSTGESSAYSESQKAATGVVSFSDAPYRSSQSTQGFKRQRANSAVPLDGPQISDATGSMRRSPTWWGRIMGNTFVERTASGRFAGSPGANAPIRDPAPPPPMSLSIIKESPRSTDTSEDDPFGDRSRIAVSASNDSSLARRATVGVSGMGIYDELGRKRRRDNQWEELRDNEVLTGMPTSQHGRSQSSLQSVRTDASSHLEAQLRGMDVVQRTRTGSSRRTNSTRRTGSLNTSEPGSLSSRMESLYERGANDRVDEALEENETPGQVVWAPTHWQTGLGSPPTAGMPLTSTAESNSLHDESLDIVDGAAGQSRDESQETSDASLVMSPEIDPRSIDQKEVSPFDDVHVLSPIEDYQAPFGSRHPESEALRRVRTHAIPREVSEVPSITPATTKRARQNPLLISPISPQPKRNREPPLTGTVKDRVREIERKRSVDPGLPPTSPETPHAMSPAKNQSHNTSWHPLGHGLPTSRSDSSADTEKEMAMMSPIRIMSPPSAEQQKEVSKKVQHGLVPRAQIVIANPDDAN